MDITNKDIFLLAISSVIGFLLGIGASVVASFVSSMLLYWKTADRVQKTMDATDKIVQKLGSTEPYTGGLRNKYRRSLGVQIDVLAQGFAGTAFREDGLWPLLTEKDGDRWHNFNEYVEPVLKELETYAYITSWVPNFSRLQCITKLCKQLEEVFELLDESFQLDLIEVGEESGKKGIRPAQGQINALEVQKLRKAYRELYKVWQEWLKIHKKKSWFS